MTSPAKKERPGHSDDGDAPGPALPAIGVVVAFVFILVATLFSAALNAYEVTYDDAFIYLRYAKNIARGCGPAFNCGGEWVEGFTSPLYQALLTVGHLFTDDGETLAISLGVLGGWIALGLAAIVPSMAVDDERSPKTATLLVVTTTLIIAADSSVLLQMFTGMETWLGWLGFAALALATYRKRLLLTGAILIFCILIRPEFLAFLPFLLLFEDFRGFRPWLGVGAALLALAAIRFWIFGEWLPNTFFVKSGGTTAHFWAGLDYLVGTFRQFPLLLATPAIFLCAQKRREHTFILGGSLIWFLYQLRSGGDFYGHSRMLMPLIPVLSALAISGLFCAGERLDDALGNSEPRLGAIAPLIGAALILAQIVLTPGRLIHTPSPQNRVTVWSEAGKWFQTTLPPDTSIATVAIGAIGYYSERPIIDLIGLTDPAIGVEGQRVDAEAQYMPIGHDTYNTREVLRRRPDVIVLLQPRPEPVHQTRTAVVGTPAEAELLQRIKQRDLDYVVTSIAPTGDRHLYLLVHSSLELPSLESPSLDPSKLKVSYRWPADRYPNLPRD